MDFLANLDGPALMTAGFILFLLICSGFFSGSETALTAASRVRMHSLEKEGDKRATIVTKLLGERERLLGGILLGNNLVNILASVLTTALFTRLFGGGGAALAGATIMMTALILIFAEVLPKTYAISQPDKLALRVARPIDLIVKILAPIVAVVRTIVNATLRLIGVSSEASWSAVDEIKGTVQLHHQEGGVAKAARDRVLGALEIAELTIEDVMIHRKNIVSVDIGLPPADAVKQILDSGHTRVPAWKDDPDNIIGVIHAKDIMAALYKANGDFAAINLAKVAREPWFVPETTRAVRQLRAFRQERRHFALAVDEYGALMGVITLEDIIEEIVGDIHDEYDEEIKGVIVQKGGAVIVRGDIPIRDINRAQDWSLPDEEAVTIAGLVIHESQSIPDVGRVFSFHGYRFEILGRQRNQITKLKITKTFEPDHGDG